MDSIRKKSKLVSGSTGEYRNAQRQREFFLPRQKFDFSVCACRAGFGASSKHSSRRRQLSGRVPLSLHDWLWGGSISGTTTTLRLRQSFSASERNWESCSLRNSRARLSSPEKNEVFSFEHGNVKLRVQLGEKLNRSTFGSSASGARRPVIIITGITRIARVPRANAQTDQAWNVLFFTSLFCRSPLSNELRDYLGWPATLMKSKREEGEGREKE